MKKITDCLVPKITEIPDLHNHIVRHIKGDIISLKL
jgi:hypothetical protein